MKCLDACVDFEKNENLLKSFLLEISSEKIPKHKDDGR